MSRSADHNRSIDRANKRAIHPDNSSSARMNVQNTRAPTLRGTATTHRRDKLFIKTVDIFRIIFPPHEGQEQVSTAKKETQLNTALCLQRYLSVRLSVCLPVCPSVVCLSVCLSVCLPACLFVYLAEYQGSNEHTY